MPGSRKVAVLDDYQNLSESAYKRLDPATYEVTIFRDTLLPYNHPDTPQDVKDQLVKRLEPFDIICTMRERTPFPAELIGRLPNLKLLLTTGTRNASLDLPALKERGIPVAGATDPGRPTQSGSDSTTEHAIALIMGAARNIAWDDAEVKAGKWQTTTAFGLAGKTVGVLGLGRLGARVARILHLAFGVKIVAWSTNLTQELADKAAQNLGLPADGPDGEKTFKAVSKEELFRTADIVSVHLVLSARSRGIISAADLALLKPDAIFVNTSRAPLVVEEDLLAVLEQGKIRSAAVDVFELEPLPAQSRWRTTKWGVEGRSQVLLSPHMGYVEKDVLPGWYGIQVDNILRWEKGEPLFLQFN
ncbi:D-isomer-specific 2-hydroxyacid dehydrogenase-like protein [Thozetella sp. PMI_491]|nr:D-isomer-specific 2-hydroxyacid dehydrogenase-like protein [Thozetella sp. PMI_491]